LTVLRQCIGPVATVRRLLLEASGPKQLSLSVGHNIQSEEHNEASTTYIFVSINYTRFVCGQTATPVLIVQRLHKVVSRSLRILIINYIILFDKLREASTNFFVILTSTVVFVWTSSCFGTLTTTRGFSSARFCCATSYARIAV
jgi:hypothetical protein